MTKQQPNPTKRCPRCGLEKPREDFYEDISKSGGLKSWCKECFNDRDHRTDNLQRRYKMTPDDWDRMLEEQRGGCGICGATEPGGRWNTWNVDHDHATGKVRGLLCFNCNTDLGRLEDKDFVEKATAYLRRHKEQLLVTKWSQDVARCREMMESGEHSETPCYPMRRTESWRWPCLRHQPKNP